jgi:hypothetical protein
MQVATHKNQLFLNKFALKINTYSGKICRAVGERAQLMFASGRFIKGMDLPTSETVPSRYGKIVGCVYRSYEFTKSYFNRIGPLLLLIVYALSCMHCIG